MAEQYNVLFLCTGNSARSIIAEAILNKLGNGRFRAYSAGSRPKGTVNAHTFKLLQDLGYETSGLRLKSWVEFAAPGAPKLHFIFTVCDSAAGEACPIWPSHPATAHWGIPDPAAVDGSPAEIAAAFAETHRLLVRRLSEFAALPFEKLSQAALQTRLRDIGRSAGATDRAKIQ
jgi:protein-tyrosine-phosphatase